MIVRYIIVILFAMLLVRCTSNESGKFLYDENGYPAIDSLARSMPLDSVIAFAKTLREHSSVLSSAEAYADGYLAWAYNLRQQGDSALKYGEKSRLKFLVLNDSLQSRVMRDLANIELLLGYYNISVSPNSSMFYLDQALNKFQKLGNTRRVIDTYMSIADNYRNAGDIKTSLRYIRNVENLRDSMELKTMYDYSWILCLLSDLSYFSNEICDYRQMDKYLELASAYYEKSDAESQLYYLEYRAKGYLNKKEYSMAAYSADRMERLAISCNDYNSIMTAYILKGLAMCRMDVFDEAKALKHKAESISELYDLIYIKEKLLLDGELAAADKDFRTAQELLFDSLEKCVNMFEYSSILDSRMMYYLRKSDYETMYALQKEQHRYVDSLQVNILFEDENDRIEATKLAQAALKDEISNLKNELELQELGDWVIKIILLGLLFSAIMVIIFQIKNSDRRNRAVVEREFKRLREDNESKMELVKKQKDMLQKTNKRISESISYAERIQQSILPRPETLNEYVSEAFVFYSPLDVVSGDFYWFTPKGDYLIVCCADCTGHGVPGAFMSMIATTLLKDVCNLAPDDVAPSDILNQLDEKIIEMLGQNQSESGAAKDGLDISLLSINLRTKSIRACSARRPIVVIKDQDIITILGIKRSIGDTEPIFRERAFVDTELQLHSGDCIYMYSDGYSDQFGGNDGAKLKNTKVKKFLRAIHDDDMDEQSLTMQELFMQWKGYYPQTDDVLFMGLRL